MRKTAASSCRFACPHWATFEKNESSQNRVRDAVLSVQFENFSCCMLLVRYKTETETEQLQYKTQF